jgi:hypothetical protein
MPTFIKAGFWEQTCNPCNGYKGWLNLDKFVQNNSGSSGSGSSGTSGISGSNGITGTSGSAGTSGASGTAGSAGTSGLTGTSGSSGLTGTSGLSGDRYQTTTTNTLTLQTGVILTFTVETGLAYTPAQDVIVSYNASNHMHGILVSYNSGTGLMQVDMITQTGSGTYSSWTVNLNGAAGGDGSSGTSGSAGTSGYGTSGTSGVAGTSGSAGTSGATGTSGSSGTAGVAGSAGTSGSSGTSPVFPLPLVYGLFAQTGNSTPITNTTVQTTLIDSGVGTLSVPADGFSIGDSFRVDFGGVIETGNNQTIRLRVSSGSAILLDSGLQTISNLTGGIWTLSINFTIRALGTAGVASIVSLGRFTYTKTVNGTLEGFSFNTVNNTTFNTTINNTLDVTAQWGAASTANSIYSDIFVLNKIY